MELEKTLKMNQLFSFYGELLTSKQKDYMSDYYEEDYTLAEIADNYGVSRQAIYDSLKRTEDTLLDYEKKLHLVKEFEHRSEILKNIKEYLEENYKEDEQLNKLINDVIQDSIREEN
ncbi:hypothetical protein SAMN02745249_00769 [Atopostipes suicloacalis DSM 15692]|uniref:UPF0122 protein SAMN02745249_00769 n=1 Tax=Atopostipes suicloacalis DSM 15692 TaxID=1121025 RepID=A0A1M4UUY2_9LACT|nr:putative DNA-binding protein [Atopostipes suicloacalis]SHE60489.1 hypothetical protein SAMN02745249_00769 [Atopostipes suicloacalis DSM 15692]